MNVGIQIYLSCSILIGIQFRRLGQEVRKNNIFLIPRDCNYNVSGWKHTGEFLLPWDAIKLPSTAAWIWVHMLDPCFTSHDNLHHEALTSSTVQMLTANYWWRLLSLSVSMHLSAFASLIEHNSWNSQASKTATTLPLLTHSVEHSASFVMQWSQTSYLNLSLNDSHLVFSFFKPSYHQ
jgi:hypothetical protein